MKRNMKILIGIIMLMIASGILENHTPVFDINYVSFIPSSLLVWMLFKKSLSLYKGLATVTIASFLYLFMANYFNLQAVLFKGLWSAIGAFLTFLCIFIYKSSKEQSV